MIHRLHSGLTVAVPVLTGESSNLKQVLSDYSSPTQPLSWHFNECESTLFVTCVILPEQWYSDRERLPETLVFATTFSGSRDGHIHELVSRNFEPLSKIFKHCESFPENAANDHYELFNYLKTYQHPSTFNSRYSCKTKKEIEQEKNLRNEIEDYLDKAQSDVNLNSLTALQVQTLIQRHIKSKGPDYDWAHRPDKKSIIEKVLSNIVTILSILLATGIIVFFRSNFKDIMIGLFCVVAALIVIGFLAIFIISRDKYTSTPRPDDDLVRALAATQLRPVINEMTAAAPLKKGWTRRLFYAASLRIIARIGRSQLEVPTVSNIRWLVIDKRKRLLFLSNYSNTTDFYVREFLTGSTPRGVNFMFTNGMGFPKASILFKGGISEDPEGYMNVIHTHQHISHLWYAHDSTITVDIVKRNSAIRNGLFAKLTEEEARRWLKDL